MSYLVLARKYRPKTFGDVVGQDHVMRPLSNALKSGRIAHAYLFSGARGVGKTTAARLLAMALSCPTPVDGEPCGDCDVCRDIIEGHAVDVFEIDGASNNGVEQIRDLRETIKYLPTKGQYKVYIVDEVHMLTKQAFNALLKTLEEPPSHVVFIFATTEAHKVLPTILSRCQRYDFKRIGVKDIVGRLEYISQTESISISQASLRLLARESEGGLRDALSLFDQVIAFSGLEINDNEVADALGLIDRTLIANLVDALLSGQAGNALDILDRVYDFGYDTKDFASQVLNYFRALVIANVSKHPEKILDLLDDELTEIREKSANSNLETLNFHFNAWLDVQNRLQRAVQPRLVLEALIVRLAQVEPLRPLAELAARLESLLEAFHETPTRGGSGNAPPAVPSSGGADYGSGFGAAGRRLSEPEPAAYKSSTQSNMTAANDFKRPEPVEIPAAKPARPVEEAPKAPPAYTGPKNWDGFVSVLRNESPLFLTFLEQGRVVQFDSQNVEIIFGQKGMTDMVDRDKLTELLYGFFGTRPKLNIHFEEGVAGAAAETAAAKKAEQEKARAEVMNNPIVREAEKIFSGNIVDVIPE